MKLLVLKILHSQQELGQLPVVSAGSYVWYNRETLRGAMWNLFINTYYFVLDQFSKWLVVRHLQLHQSLPVIKASFI